MNPDLFVRVLMVWYVGLGFRGLYIITDQTQTTLVLFIDKSTTELRINHKLTTCPRTGNLAADCSHKAELLNAFLHLSEFLVIAKCF